MEQKDDKKPTKKVRGKDKAKRKLTAQQQAKKDAEKAKRESYKPIAKCSPMQENYCLAWMRIKNKTGAYKAAGYAWENMKAETIWHRAHDVSMLPQVQARIAELEAKVVEKTIMSVTKIGERLTEMVEDFDPANSFDAKGNLLPIDQMPKINRLMIQAIDSMELKDGAIVRKVKHFDPSDAMDKLLKMAGGYVRDNVNVTVQNNSTVLDVSKLDTDTLLKMKAAYVKKEDES